MSWYIVINIENVRKKAWNVSKDNFLSSFYAQNILKKQILHIENVGKWQLADLQIE